MSSMEFYKYPNSDTYTLSVYSRDGENVSSTSLRKEDIVKMYNAIREGL